MSTQLPESKSSDLELVQPTTQEIQRQTELNSDEWKGALSLDAYLRREEHLGRQDLVHDGGLTPWALVTKGGDSRLVLSSCETIRKKALVAHDGQVKEVICHGVASVFCPPEYRGRGYAGRMIKDLGQELQTWQTDDSHDCLFSVLYSDIGKVSTFYGHDYQFPCLYLIQQFYAAHEWKPYPSAQISLTVPSGSHIPPLPEARLLYAHDLEELCDVDRDLIYKQLTKAAVSGKTAVSIVPDVETLSWQHAREEFVANELYSKSPTVKGAIVGTESGKRVWCVWYRTWNNNDPQNAQGNTMTLLRLVAEGAEASDAASDEGAKAAKDSYISAATASLLVAARAEASKWHMGAVDIWNPTSATLAAASMLDPAVRVVHREKDSIASLRWYGERSVQDVVWVDNEKYAWC
jgi:hypothetical protein